MITMANLHYSQAADTPQIGYIWTDASGTTFGQLNFTRLSDITFRGAQEARDFSALVAELAVRMDREADRARNERGEAA
jgi:hypothetical protein